MNWSGCSLLSVRMYLGPSGDYTIRGGIITSGNLTAPNIASMSMKLENATQLLNATQYALSQTRAALTDSLTLIGDLKTQLAVLNASLSSNALA